MIAWTCVAFVHVPDVVPDPVARRHPHRKDDEPVPLLPMLVHPDGSVGAVLLPDR